MSSDTKYKMHKFNFNHINSNFQMVLLTNPDTKLTTDHGLRQKRSQERQYIFDTVRSICVFVYLRVYLYFLYLYISQWCTQYIFDTIE